VPRPNDRFYDLLEVRPDVNPEGLDLSYERIHKRLSSERYQAAHPGAAKRLKQVERAYEVLSNPELRPLYDEFGEKALVPGFDVERARRASGEDRWWSPPPRLPGAAPPEPPPPPGVQAGGPPGTPPPGPAAAPVPDVDFLDWADRAGLD